MNTAPPPSRVILTASPEGRALHQIKGEIDLFYEEGKWDDYKKITNPYEYIFLSWNRRSSRSVATRQPLSRSYFKMIELWDRLELSTYLAAAVERDGGFATTHAAEGPGGFIEACTVRAEKTGWVFKAAHAITLRSEAKNVPGWRKAAKFLESNPHVKIHDGADGTGNILCEPNQAAFITHVRTEHPGGVHLFTADGGFDFSKDYTAQEDTIFPLLFAEVLLGLQVLAKGGVLVIKCFDTLERPTHDLIWLTTRAFCEWGIVKPCTSRAGNAERFIVCKGYLGDCDDVLGILRAYQAAGLFKQPVLQTPSCDSYRSLAAQIACLQEKIEHVETQIITETLALIKHTDRAVIRNLVRSNVMRSMEWCAAHDEPVANIWATKFEEHVGRETADLLHILNPPDTLTYTGWTTRTSSISTLTFEGFRSGTARMPPATNPFMRPR
jgi:23S rRNA U2552 (ribose-2'-O)-methylase RlmE/FtsJ